MLELTRNIGRENARLNAGEPWQIMVGLEAEGRTLALSALASSAPRFETGAGLRHEGHRLEPESDAGDVPEVGVACVAKEELFSTADVITIHLVLSKRTRGLIGRDELARMKPSAFLVNTARGPIVDEGALLEVLTQKKIAGAGIDVFSVEPLPVDRPFRKLDNSC